VAAAGSVAKKAAEPTPEAKPVARPITSPLVSAEVLAEQLDDATLRVVDVRWYLGRPGDGRHAYEAGHIPGAIFLDIDGDLALAPGPGLPGRHPLPDPTAFVGRLEAAGIGDGDVVVAYDDVGGWVAARLWWMLDALGHRSAAVLDGGIAAWLASDGPVTTDVPILAPGRLHLAARWSRTIDRDELRARLGSAVIVDARGAPRYRGETEPIDPVAGHIPTAVSAPTDGNLTAEGRFLPADALRTRFGVLGIEADAPSLVVSYCGSGVAACMSALAMRIAGLPDPILYPGSWSDWSTAGFPVATGPEPGDPPA
jgi:thiosulfate/3-mercaptopyruvate sulfurtransferase